MQRSPEFYQHYPKLFHTYFKTVTNETINSLSLAGYQYYNSLIILDRILDDGVTDKTLDMILLQEESVKQLSAIFGRNHQFWKLWNQRRKEFLLAVKMEAQLKNKASVDFKTYQELADNKSSFGKVAIDSLFILEGNQSDVVYKTLLQSHKHFSTGFQLYDDVSDFKEDFQKGQFNYAVFELEKVIDFDKYRQDVNILNKLLFIKGVGQNILAKSIEQFEVAIQILGTLNSQSKWLQTVEEMKSTIMGYLDATDGYLATIKKRKDIKHLHNNTYSFFDYQTVEDSGIKKGLNIIKSDFQNNYADLKHIMYLGQLEGFDNATQIHVSDTFQRAMIDDCFITISQSCQLDIANFIKNECTYLLGLRNQDAVGAWSYFPMVNEIAADIDDLAQIMHLFNQSGHQQFIDAYCINACDLAINERMLPNGGIETWIIPQKDQTDKQKKQEHFNGTKWGKGPDVEVVANFIYALDALERECYYDTIQNAIAYILSEQKEEGYWKSRWYYGKYYGTYVCLRLLKKWKNDYKPEIKKAMDYLVGDQNPDGGYSINSEEKSDPLSTSLALLGLKLFYENDHVAIVRAVHYLKDSQAEDGSWKAVNFIKPKVHEPYKSKTLTTAFVLKAICS